MANTQSPAPGVAAEREKFETWLKTKPEARFWNTTDAMLAAFIGGTALQASAAAVEPAAWVVWWGIGNMQKNSVHFERKTAEEVAGEIKSVTEIRPLYTAPPLPAQGPITPEEVGRALDRVALSRHTGNSEKMFAALTDFLASRTPAPGMAGGVGIVPEIFGERCADDGKCHHACKTECWRRTSGCVPLGASGLNDDWTRPAAPHPSPAVQVAGAAPELNFWEIAATAALNSETRHPYLPSTYQEMVRWQPHGWVIDAMQAAIAASRSAAGRAGS